MTDIQKARDVLAKWRKGTTPGPWAFTVDTYGSDFGDYQAAEVTNVAESVWTENDGPVAPLTPEDASLIVGTAGNPDLLDALDQLLEAAFIHVIEHDEELIDPLVTTLAAAIIAAEKRMSA